MWSKQNLGPVSERGLLMKIVGINGKYSVKVIDADDDYSDDYSDDSHDDDDDDDDENR